MKRALLLLALLMIHGCGGDGEGQQRPLTLIVPTAPGGGTDTVARVLATQAEPALGAPIGVKNLPGASSAIGMFQGANAPADGETLTMVVAELAILKSLGLADIDHRGFAPIMLVNYDPAAITVRRDAPYDTINEFLDYAREHPNALLMGNSGTGSIWHVAAETFGHATDTRYTHVPYEGAAPAITALLGGHIDAVSVSAAEVLPYVNSGEFKILGVMAEQRIEALPQAPTFTEAGVDTPAFGTWRGLVVPAGTPQERIDQLAAAFAEAAQSSEFQAFMASRGFGIQILPPAEFASFLDEQAVFFERTLSTLGLAP